MLVETATVREHQDFQGGYRLLTLDAPGIAPDVRPGQFVHIRVPHMEDAVLRRPFSVFRTDGACLSVLYKEVGRGTHTMKMLQPGDGVSLLGPLGKGFPVEGVTARPVLVAGGYGMAALYMAARELTPGHAFFGGAAEADILCVADFEALGWTVHVTTEDGSLGTQGLVTDALEPWLSEEGGTGPVEFFACGPNGMLRAVGDRAQRLDSKAWISVDQPMCCGVGACLTCVVKIRRGEDWAWARSCKEGPVFECREIVWEEKT
jgi:dihydroorotate dehydrogenase electron transfer subunit